MLVRTWKWPGSGSQHWIYPRRRSNSTRDALAPKIVLEHTKIFNLAQSVDDVFFFVNFIICNVSATWYLEHVRVQLVDFYWQHPPFTVRVVLRYTTDQPP
jgi:hypothetical protein